VADPDISFGGPRGAEVELHRREDQGAWGVGVPLCTGGEVWGGGYAPFPENFLNVILKNSMFWSILMSKCVSHVYTCIAYFYFRQYKPTS